ncbi:hypothetical protein VNO77_24590 [Canavalia gladiata]|uniref:Uncharacterized protein n=1 Tax=Canavalia gladiata TaxID=3824 RepID=A0AAN9QCP0_CANGL
MWRLVNGPFWSTSSRRAACLPIETNRPKSLPPLYQVIDLPCPAIFGFLFKFLHKIKSRITFSKRRHYLITLEPTD